MRIVLTEDHKLGPAGAVVRLSDTKAQRLIDDGVADAAPTPAPATTKANPDADESSADTEET